MAGGAAGPARRKTPFQWCQLVTTLACAERGCRFCHRDLSPCSYGSPAGDRFFYSVWKFVLPLSGVLT